MFWVWALGFAVQGLRFRVQKTCHKGLIRDPKVVGVLGVIMFRASLSWSFSLKPRVGSRVQDLGFGI